MSWEPRESDLGLKSDNYEGGDFSSFGELVFRFSGSFWSLSFALDLAPDFIAGRVDCGDFFSGVGGITEVPTVVLVASSLTTDFLTAGSGVTDFASPPSVREPAELWAFSACEEDGALDFPGFAETAIAPFFGETILTGGGLTVVV